MDKLAALKGLRIKIDKIDLKILDLISDRQSLVKEVVRYKNRDQIVDEKRIEYILCKLDEEAKKRGIPQELVRELWKSMIKSFISYEEQIFDKREKK